MVNTVLIKQNFGFVDRFPRAWFSTSKFCTVKHSIYWNNRSNSTPQLHEWYNCTTWTAVSSIVWPQTKFRVHVQPSNYSFWLQTGTSKVTTTPSAYLKISFLVLNSGDYNLVTECSESRLDVGFTRLDVTRWAFLDSYFKEVAHDT